MTYEFWGSWKCSCLKTASAGHCICNDKSQNLSKRDPKIKANNEHQKNLISRRFGVPRKYCRHKVKRLNLSVREAQISYAIRDMHIFNVNFQGISRNFANARTLKKFRALERKYKKSSFFNINLVAVCAWSWNDNRLGEINEILSASQRPGISRP